MNHEKLLRLKDVMEITGIKRSKLYDLVNRGLFPQPVRIDTCVHWPESRVRKWVDDLIAQSDAENVKGGNDHAARETAA